MCGSFSVSRTDTDLSSSAVLLRVICNMLHGLQMGKESIVIFSV
jgi:hypothetical protein